MISVLTLSGIFVFFGLVCSISVCLLLKKYERAERILRRGSKLIIISLAALTVYTLIYQRGLMLQVLAAGGIFSVWYLFACHIFRILKNKK
jgi:hypothetical protein